MRAVTEVARFDTTLTPDAAARVVFSTLVEPADETAGRLIQRLGAVDALEMLTERSDLTYEGLDIAVLRERALARYAPGRAVQALQQAGRFGATLLTPESSLWPARLAQLGDATPYALWIRGDAALLGSEWMTTIVGSRAATAFGHGQAHQLATGLSEIGHTIVSDAAYGISGEALRSTLAAGGRAVAVLAGGVDRFFPSGHDALLGRTASVGVVISELACGTPPTRWRWAARNRILAALSGAVVVVEAGERSGALGAASHAQQMQIPVGCIAGPADSAASAGCRLLLSEWGATAITNSAEAAALQP